MQSYTSEATHELTTTPSPPPSPTKSTNLPKNSKKPNDWLHNTRLRTSPSTRIKTIPKTNRKTKIKHYPPSTPIHEIFSLREVPIKAVIRLHCARRHESTNHDHTSSDHCINAKITKSMPLLPRKLHRIANTYRKHTDSSSCVHLPKSPDDINLSIQEIRILRQTVSSTA